MKLSQRKSNRREWASLYNPEAVVAFGAPGVARGRAQPLGL
jgi:hypothetical protein